MPSPFPDLPIITPPTTERLSAGEKYGPLFYLGLAGLAALLGLIGWFAYGLAENWSVWTRIYTLHDSTKPEAARIAAAFELAQDRRVNQRQYWDMVLRPELPALARYRLAEALTAEATATDPSGYAKTVAYSTGWPAWLRVLLTRPMGYAVNRGIAFPPEPVRELSLMDDPLLRVWSTYVQSLQSGGDPAALKRLEEIAGERTPASEVARLLIASLHEKEPARTEKLDEATRLMRRASPESAQLWQGWDDRPER